MIKRGSIRIGQAAGTGKLYFFDMLWNLREPGDPRNPDPSRRSWVAEEQIGPSPIDPSLLPTLSFFEDWEWNLAESDAPRFAARQVYNPTTRAWTAYRTRQNWK